MSININELDDNVREDILNSLGLEDLDVEDERVQNAFKTMTVGEAFDKFLSYNGIIGYSEFIAKGLDSIRKAEVQDPAKTEEEARLRIRFSIDPAVRKFRHQIANALGISDTEAGQIIYHLLEKI